MSNTQPQGRMKETERIVQGPGPGRGPFAGGMVGQKANSFKPSAKRLIGTMRPERLKVYVILVLAVGSVVLMSFGPKILGQATDHILGGILGRAQAHGFHVPAKLSKSTHLTNGIDFTAVRNVLLIAVAVYVIASLLSFLQGYVLNGVVQSSISRMRGDVEDKVNRLPLSYFDSQPRGELLSRVTNDIDNISQTLQQTMSQLLTSLLSVVAVLSMMIWISPLLAVIALVTVPVSIFATKQVMSRSQGRFIEQWRRTGRLNAHIEETFSGQSLVKVFGRQREAEERFAVENDELFEASFKAQFISGLVMPLMMLIGNLNYVLVAVIGGLRVASGSMSLGDVQAFIQYSRQFTQPLTQVASMANLLQSGVASAERVFELLDAPEESAEPVSVVFPVDSRGRVEFEHVQFSYLPDQPLIEDLSLVAAPGQTVAIVGPTGAGKTTLVNLVMRFYEVTGGRITLDGIDIATMPRGELRSRTGMVLQDTWLFAGTIRDNIAYGSPGANEEQILTAARATFVDRFVHSLPDGYDTLIDEEGANLSAGERQLITIARAFLSNPDLLILDEATSSVDTRTELLLQKAMGALREDRTSFVIAHRLSTIRDADLILVMEHGAIVEQGTHDSLLADDGAYARLYRSQFEAALESVA